MAWPFTRARSAWLSGYRILNTMAELWDSQIAQAADGEAWSDVALAQNWLFDSSVSGITNTKTCVWDETRALWLLAGDNGTDPQVRAMYRSGTLRTLGSIGAGLTVGNEAAAIATGGNWLLGGNPTGSAATKIRYSSDGGANWSTGTMNTGGTSAVTVLHTFTNASLVVAGLDNGAIETSPTGATWTLRTNPNANAIQSAASNSSIMVMSSSASTNKVITSPDGVTWTERTMPASAVWWVTWDAADSVFVAINATTAAKSADGITWTATGITSPNDGGAARVTCLGHVLVAYTGGSGEIYTSIDVGLTWRLVAGFAGANYCVRAGDHQLVAILSDTGTHLYRTLALGGRDLST